MVDQHVPNLGIVDDAALILENWFRIDSRRDWSSCVDFGLDLVRHRSKTIRKVGVRSILGNRRVRIASDGFAVARRVTCSTGVYRGTARVDVRTESIRRIRRACYVGHAGCIWNGTSLLNKLVDSSVRSAMTGAGDRVPAVEDILNTEIDLGT